MDDSTTFLWFQQSKDFRYHVTILKFITSKAPLKRKLNPTSISFKNEVYLYSSLFSFSVILCGSSYHCLEGTMWRCTTSPPLTHCNQNQTGHTYSDGSLLNKNGNDRTGIIAISLFISCQKTTHLARKLNQLILQYNSYFTHSNHFIQLTYSATSNRNTAHTTTYKIHLNVIFKMKLNLDGPPVIAECQTVLTYIWTVNPVSRKLPFCVWVHSACTVIFLQIPPTEIYIGTWSS
jgi:hypothetical protein